MSVLTSSQNYVSKLNALNSGGRSHSSCLNRHAYDGRAHEFCKEDAYVSWMSYTSSSGEKWHEYVSFLYGEWVQSLIKVQTRLSAKIAGRRLLNCIKSMYVSLCSCFKLCI